MRTEESLREEIADAKAQLDSICAQMDKAIAHKRGTGQSSDEDWFAQAKAERRRLGRIIGDLQQQLGQVCRKERANRTVSFERVFVRKAEALLPRDLYLLVFTAAQAECP